MFIESKISEILANRKANLPIITQEIGRWQNTLNELRTLGTKLQEYNQANSEHPISHTALDGIQGRIPKILQELDSLYERFNRGTINIGVSG